MAVTINGTTGVAVPLGTASAPGVVNTTSSTTGIYNPTSTTLALATNGTQAVTVDASQNVGIGTSSPGYTLDVLGSLVRYASTSSSGYALLQLGRSATATQNWHFGSEGDGTFNWYNGNYGSGTKRVTIDSAGIVTGTAGNLMLVQPTAQASTSGTSIDFTGIPSWVKRITVNFSGVSTNGTSVVQIQLGTSSGPTTTGYASGAFSYNTGAGSTSTTGLVVDQSTAATNVRYGSIVISTLGSNVWASQGILIMTATGSVTPSAGGVTLGAVLDRIRITTVNGTDTFDAGTINIQYE